uniref:6-cysteine protein n=1 Tax=Parastrongyloides trichosuri TaxID=131310 RepID=A0A0N5A7G9_PARTI
MRNFKKSYIMRSITFILILNLTWNVESLLDNLILGENFFNFFSGRPFQITVDTDLVFLPCIKEYTLEVHGRNHIFKHIIYENEKDVFYSEDGINNNYKLVRPSKLKNGTIYFSIYCKYSTLRQIDPVNDRTDKVDVTLISKSSNITSEYVIDKKESLPKCPDTSDVLYVRKDTSNKLSIEYNLKEFDNSFHECTLYVFDKNVTKYDNFFWGPCKILKLKNVLNEQKAQKSAEENATVEFITFFVFLVIIISIILCIVMLVRRRRKRNNNVDKVGNEERNKTSETRHSTWNVRVGRTRSNTFLN